MPSKITALYNNVCGLHIYIEAVLKMHVKLLQGWSMFSYKKNDVFYVRRFNYFLVSTLSLILTGILNSKEKIFFFSLEKNYLSVTGYILLIKNPLYYMTYNFQTSFLMVCITKLQIINTHVTKHMHCRIDNQKLLLRQIHFKLS